MKNDSCSNKVNMMGQHSQLIERLLGIACLLGLCLSAGLAQQPDGSLRGQVTDELGALVVGATVTVIAADGTQKTSVTNAEGTYTFSSLTPGRYIVRIFAPGFSSYEKAEVEVTVRTRTTHNAQMVVGLENQEVTVADDGSLNTDPANNANAIVLRGQELDVLPDDPDALAAAVQAMAGPTVGPDGGGVFIDGFTGGRMPPKDSIREVRINQNPFNAENNGIGFGRIDIFTKPGMEKLRVSTFFNFGDESLNSRNPFAPRRVPFQVRYYGGSISGSIIPQKASFFLDFQQRVIEDNAIINATILNPSFQVIPFRLALVTPNRNLSFSPRFDYQLNTNHTLIMRYSYSRTRAENIGASDFSLPQRAYNRSNTEQTVQLTETAVLSPTMINETRFQYIRNRSLQDGNNTIPTVVAQEAFISGGSQIGLAHNNEDRFELQNYSTLTTGKHVLRFGIRLRGVRITDFSPQNFGGTFTFSGGNAPQLNANNEIVRDANGDAVPVSITSIERFRRTLLFQERSDLRSLGGGATQFSIAGGNPEASVSQVDLGAFIQDEWRIRPNLTFTAGLRYERQTNISSNFNFAPRLFFAWAPGGNSVVTGQGGSSSPKMVIRGGMGVFYDRFGERATLLATRFNGVNQLDFRVFDPTHLDVATFSLNGVTNVPTVESLAAFASPQIVRRIADDFQAPTFVMTAINIERQLPSKFTFFAVAFNYRGKHLLRVRNINAPLPGTYDPNNPNSSVRPFGNIGDIYYYESSAKFNDYRFFGGLRRQMTKGFSMFANFGMGRGKTDTDCIFGSIGSCFPADTYDLSSEYSRVGFIPSGNLFVGATIAVPRLKLTLNPFIVFQSGRPFNIVTGRDTNGDGVFTERPAFATEQTDPADLKRTRFGDFDLNPAAGQALIPRNYGMGHSFFFVNLGISRSFTFGDAPVAAAAIQPPAAGVTQAATSKAAPAQPGAAKPTGNTPAGNTSTTPAGAPAKPSSGPAPEKRYNVTLSINIQNLLNHTNLAQPIGNLSSPRFGESTANAGSFGFGPGGSAAAGNRRIQLQVRFTF